ncbi:recombination protein RecR [bacterium]|nr:recombination protein RecR [bacterium]
MGVIPKSLKTLTLELQRLPGIGSKSARRIAYFLFSLPEERLSFLGDSLKGLKHSVTMCSFCRILADTNPCDICGDVTREVSSICIVADHMDVYAIERTAGYKGMYYVLGGLLSPIKGHGPEDIAVEGLLKRVHQLKKIQRQGVKLELIFALSPTTEGQTTALYLKEEIMNEFGDDVLLSRVAVGISVGTDIDYVDTYTLQESLKGRSSL